MEQFIQQLNNIDRRLIAIESDQKEMNKTLTNHFMHLSADYQQLVTDVKWLKEFRAENLRPTYDTNGAEIKTQTDVDWLKRFFWIAAATTITSLISSVLTVIYK